MRLCRLTLSDINFQYKYGFYFLYVALTIFYISIIILIPEDWRKIITPILIFTDPAAMGLYFMGAIVLLEKSQRVLDSIAISPVTTHEYIIGKVVSLGIIGTIVGGLISIFNKPSTILLTIQGVFLSSVFCSLVAMTLAFRVKSLNQFVIATVPFQIFFGFPPILYLLGLKEFGQILHPGVASIKMIGGAAKNPVLLIVILLLWIILAGALSLKTVNKEFLKLG